MTLSDPIVELLLSGAAETLEEAEEMYLDQHIPDVLALVESPLTDQEFRDHPLIQLLFSRGSRDWEDGLG